MRNETSRSTLKAVFAALGAWTLFSSWKVNGLAQKKVDQFTTPSWLHLEEAILPSAPLPKVVDFSVRQDETAAPNTPILFRERNGWCIYSARLWLALELKGVKFQTTLVDTCRYDTYDGTFNQDIPWPNEIENHEIPQFQYDGKLHCGATEASNLILLESLDELFPETPSLWSMKDDTGGTNCHENPSSVTKNFRDLAIAFDTTVSNCLGDARKSPRAGFLFCSEEGYRLDVLPRSNFEKFLDHTESLLPPIDYCNGAFFGGSHRPTGVDVVWAPLLERFVAQLPCLHEGLFIRNNPRWPRLDRWYRAMDSVPAYICRVKGDAPSWRKVLFTDPWWPSVDIWHPRDTVGPKGELKASEDECIQAFGAIDDEKIQHIWEEYTSLRPFVCPHSPAEDAAAILVRNRGAIIYDFGRWLEENYSHNTNAKFDTNTIESSMKAIVLILCSMKGIQYEFSDQDRGDCNDLFHVKGVPEMLSYLDDRVCVPRDMGALSVAAIRNLHRYSQKF